jgi:hypothetical protein
MTDTVIYVKTPKGIQEITQRSAGLNQKARQMLILMDGKRSVNELAEVLEGVVVDDLVKILLDGELVVPLNNTAVAPKVTSPAQLPLDENQRFVMSKNFMCNTVNTFLGSMGSGLVSRLNKCNNLDELRQLYVEWQKAIAISSDGRKQAAELENKLAALLS